VRICTYSLGSGGGGGGEEKSCQSKGGGGSGRGRMVVYRFDGAALIYTQPSCHSGVSSSEVRLYRGAQTITATHVDTDVDLHTLFLSLLRSVYVCMRI